MAEAMVHLVIGALRAAQELDPTLHTAQAVLLLTDPTSAPGSVAGFTSASLMYSRWVLQATIVPTNAGPTQRRYAWVRAEHGATTEPIF